MPRATPPALAAVSLVPTTSRSFRRGLWFAHAALAALAVIAFDGRLPGLVLGLACLWHARQFERDRRREARAVRSVLFDSAGLWWLWRPEGTQVAATVGHPQLLTPWLMLIPLRAADAGEPLLLVLLEDNTPLLALRRLRVRLLWSKAGD